MVVICFPPHLKEADCGPGELTIWVVTQINDDVGEDISDACVEVIINCLEPSGISVRMGYHKDVEYGP